WTVFAFLDGGAVRKNKRPWRPEEDYSEARAGAGIGLSTPEQFPVSGRVEYAVPIQLTDEAGGATAGRWRVRASWRFGASCQAASQCCISGGGPSGWRPRRPRR